MTRAVCGRNAGCGGGRRRRNRRLRPAAARRKASGWRGWATAAAVTDTRERGQRRGTGPLVVPRREEGAGARRPVPLRDPVRQRPLCKDRSSVKITFSSALLSKGILARMDRTVRPGTPLSAETPPRLGLCSGRRAAAVAPRLF